jgi:hypothetical protein
MTTTDANRDASLGAAAYASLRPDLITKLVADGAPIMTAFQPAPAPSAVSGVARRTLSDQLKTSGVAAYKTLAAAAAPAQAAQAATAGSTTVDSTAFDKLNAIAVAAELLQRDLTPALRLEDNEVTLSATSTTPWVGIAAVLSADEPGSAIVSGNRVVTPDTATVACAVMLPLSAVVTGNLFVQLGTRRDGGSAAPSLVVLTASPLIMVASNVVTQMGEYVRPLRTTTPAPGWDFLNSAF